MNGFMLAVIGFAGAMGIPALLTAVAESTATRFGDALPARVRAVARRRQIR